MSLATNTKGDTCGAVGSWGGDTERYLTPQHNYEIEDWSIPEDDPLLWSLEEQCRAKACAMLFSSEYMFDFDAYKAFLRLGLDPGMARTLKRSYMNCPLVQRHIRHRMQNFRKQNAMTEDTVLSWIYQEATDKSVMANPLARVKAQSLLAKYLRLEGQEEKTTNINLNGGVMLVSPIDSPENWEARATKPQSELQTNA